MNKRKIDKKLKNKKVNELINVCMNDQMDELMYGGCLSWKNNKVKEHHTDIQLVGNAPPPFPLSCLISQ